MSRLFLIWALLMSHIAYCQSINFTDYCTITIDSAFKTSGINEPDFPKTLKRLVRNTFIAHQSELNYKVVKGQQADFSFWMTYRLEKSVRGPKSILSLNLKDNNAKQLLTDVFTYGFYQKKGDTTAHFSVNREKLLQQIQKRFGDELIPYMISSYTIPANARNHPSYSINVGITMLKSDNISRMSDSEIESIMEMVKSVIIIQLQQYEKAKINFYLLYGENQIKPQKREDLDVILQTTWHYLEGKSYAEILMDITGDSVLSSGRGYQSIVFDVHAFRQNKHRANYLRMATAASLLKMDIRSLEFMD